ncbi:MAG: SLC13 family permease, partial [Desulfohalobiaceae bacterium]
MTPPPFSPDMALVFAVIGVTVVLFLTEWLRVDVVAILVMVSLPMLGLISGREAFNGLASNAVVSIIAVIIMGRGLDHTGVINRLVRPLVELAGSSRQRIIVLLSGTVAVISSLMQNIGAAALFLPAIQRMSRSTGIPVAKLLMPVGFSAILGGTVTLVGSSPLIMLNDLLRPYGLAPFSLFSVTPMGVALVVAGIAYFLLFSSWVLPRSREDTAASRSEDPLAYYPELGRMYEITADTGLREPPLVMDLYDGFGVHVVALTLPGGTDTLIPPDRDLR